MFFYQYFPEQKFNLTVFYSEISSAEIHQVIDKLAEINLIEDNMSGLTIICNNARPKKLKVKDIMAMGERMQKICYKNTFKNAFLTKTIIAYSLARIYKMVVDLTTTDEMKIYKEKGINNAIQWLDISEIEDEIKNIIYECEDFNDTSIKIT